MSLFKYEIKGVELDIHDMIQISEYYEAACTAEFALDLYSDMIESQEQALQIGYRARRKMNKWGLYDGDSEQDAIKEVLEEMELWIDD